MTGGILLPGTAEPSDVASGKTFSSGVAGFNATGTLAAPIIGTPATSSFVSTGSGFAQRSSLSITVTGVLANSNVLLGICNNGSVSGTVSSVTTTSATWSLVGLHLDSSTGAEVWLYQCTNMPTGTNTISISMGANVYCAAIAIPVANVGSAGSEFDGVASGGATYGTNTLQSITIAANGLGVLVNGSNGNDASNGNLMPSSAAAPQMMVSVGASSANASPIGMLMMCLYPATSSGTYELGYLQSWTGANVPYVGASLS